MYQKFSYHALLYTLHGMQYFHWYFLCIQEIGLVNQLYAVISIILQNPNAFINELDINFLETNQPVPTVLIYPHIFHSIDPLYGLLCALQRQIHHIIFHVLFHVFACNNEYWLYLWDKLYGNVRILLLFIPLILLGHLSCI